MLRIRRAHLLALISAAPLIASPALAASKPAAFTIVATEVTVKDAKSGDQAAIVTPLQTASDEEAHYYDPALLPMVMRIHVQKVGYKSAGKALAAGIPFVGLVTGSNRNVLKGEVELIDRASEKVVQKFKIEADDDTFFSAGDTALSLGKTALSFLPFGMLASSAVDVAQGAASNHAASQKMLTRGFVMLSYRKAYGDKAYRVFAARRKAALAASAPKPEAASPTIAAATPAPTTLARAN